MRMNKILLFIHSKLEKSLFEETYMELEDKYYKEKHDREYFEEQVEYWKSKFYKKGRES